MQELDLLISALSSIGVNTNHQALEVIFKIKELVEEKGEELNLKEIRQTALEISQKYAGR
jgi:hypothetical protein